jgi:PHD/YefM family antitoxin component YafN of YafNO toxin-antitoxin module
MIQLTPQQQQALDAEENRPTRLVDPRTNTAYVLLLESEYESIRELLDDERQQQAIHAAALRNAAARLDEAPE